MQLGEGRWTGLEDGHVSSEVDEDLVRGRVVTGLDEVVLVRDIPRDWRASKLEQRSDKVSRHARAD